MTLREKGGKGNSKEATGKGNVTMTKLVRRVKRAPKLLDVSLGGRSQDPRAREDAGKMLAGMFLANQGGEAEDACPARGGGPWHRPVRWSRRGLGPVSFLGVFLE